MGVFLLDVVLETGSDKFGHKVVVLSFGTVVTRPAHQPQMKTAMYALTFGGRHRIHRTIKDRVKAPAKGPICFLLNLSF
jgi:hypothetical protein